MELRDPLVAASNGDGEMASSRAIGSALIALILPSSIVFCLLAMILSNWIFDVDAEK